MLLPQTRASAAFHDQTATGKLNAEMMPVTPSGCQGLRHTVLVALRGYRQAVELPGKTRGEVADVDHLLDFAEAFGFDLADLDRNESTEGALVGAQLFAKEPHEFTALGTRDQTPFEESRVSLSDRHGRVGGGDLPDVRHGFAGNWGFRDQRATVIAGRFDTEFKQKRIDTGLECEVSGFGGLLDHID